MCKKRIIVLSICGIMATSLVSAFLLPVRARSMGISFPLLHHHSEACLGKVVRRPARISVRTAAVRSTAMSTGVPAVAGKPGTVRGMPAITARTEAIRKADVLIIPP